MEAELYTYQDLVHRVLDTFGEGQLDGRNERLAKRAVIDAYRRLATLHDWTYYQRRRQVTTAASQTTGTIQYDHTGNGSGERVVLLTGATFPTNARFYKILIDAVVYPIENYVDSTTVQLPAFSNPGADVAAGTSYNLFRSVYPLPNGTRAITPPVDLSRGYYLTPMPADIGLDHMAGNYTPSEEQGFAVHNAGEYYGSVDIEFFPPPASARTYDYIATLNPRPLKTMDYTTGTVSTSTTTVTGSGTTFSADHVGSIIRFGDASNVPTAQDGNLSGEYPYVAQRTVMSVSTTTSLTIDAALTSEVSGVKYCISDVIDVDPISMFSALEALAISNYARYALDDKAQQRYYESVFRDTLIQAMTADNRYRNDFGGIDRRGYDLKDWAIDESYGGSIIT